MPSEIKPEWVQTALRWPAADCPRPGAKMSIGLAANGQRISINAVLQKIEATDDPDWVEVWFRWRAR